MSDYEKNVRNAVMNVICNAMNFPKTASVHILGQDMGPLGDKIIDALLPIIAATRTAALEEAAVIAERYDKGYGQHPNDGIVKATQTAIARVIRSARVGD